jgi:CHAT domain-containing protein
MATNCARCWSGWWARRAPRFDQGLVEPNLTGEIVVATRRNIERARGFTRPITRSNAARPRPLADYSIIYFYFASHRRTVAGAQHAEHPSELDDGLLTSSEVAQLKLDADWVVLSACNTIAGDKSGAEVLSGLARSFFYAGARAILVSHWAVSSEAATRLATSTLDRLKANPKISRTEALRQAMLGYLNDKSSPRNAYPAFWGPFALIGEGAAR